VSAHLREERFFRKVFLAMIANGMQLIEASSLRDARNAEPLRARYERWAGSEPSEACEEILCALRADPLNGCCDALQRAQTWLLSTGLGRSYDGLETFEPTLSKADAERELEPLDPRERAMLRDLARIICAC
jgi:hypothetical protein